MTHLLVKTESMGLEANSFVRLPIPTRASKDRVHSFAEDVANKLTFQPGGALEPLVALLGGRISHQNPFTEAGRAPPSIEVTAAANFVIHVPPTTSPQRNRFTIAHELGHLFLHYPMVQRQYPGATMIATRWVNESDPDQQRAEWEANWFAAAFLMPSQCFKDILAASPSDLASVAAKFGVSEQAARIRARSFGLG